MTHDLLCLFLYYVVAIKDEAGQTLTSFNNYPNIELKRQHNLPSGNKLYILITR
jgi:hypothetical protein